ncbi:TadE family protein [Pyxidicoccus xibeiensis]|uniref:TadE family protein n=1 Tax=Pyxidicoccus xibeiensis TaxID=2906759 RepID=UPI0020A7F83D|nr:TadE family protein [Pyxidicoccus xibeiensis]MCP3137497.1 pilus assembly protein [Pyxidicoccus xibeiensis]
MGAPTPPGSRRQSGQAAIESAVVLPLYVFLILGTLQLSLMHQARLMTKYAAYRAVRAGSLNHARVKPMERAALAALLPLVSRDAGNGVEHIQPVDGAERFLAKWRQWQEVRENVMPGGLPVAEVTVCGPLARDMPTGVDQVDFDDPRWAGASGWHESMRTKLRVQVTFNYRMPIPFANMVIYSIAHHRSVPSMLRLERPRRASDPPASPQAAYDALASNGVYVLPIRATYTLRMQSNLFPRQDSLPEKNRCVFPFRYD